MKICNNQVDLDHFLDEAFGASDRTGSAEDNPILIDKFLSDAIEVDVDAVADYGREGGMTKWGTGLKPVPQGRPCSSDHRGTDSREREHTTREADSITETSPSVCFSRPTASPEARPKRGLSRSK